MKFLQLLSLSAWLGILLFSCNKDNREACCPDGPTSFQVGNGRVYVPNIVTDNSDGYNDVFFPLASTNIVSIEDFKIVVGGKVLFEKEQMSANNPGEGWSPVRESNFLGRFKYGFVAVSADGTKEAIIGTSCSYFYKPDSPPSLDCSNCRFGSQHDGQGDFCENCPNFEDMCR